MHRFTVLNLLLAILPLTGFASLKRILCRLHGIKVGHNTLICGSTCFYGSGRVTIGSNSHIGIGTRIFSTGNATITIGDNVALSPFVTLHTGSHSMGCAHRRAGTGKSLDITIGSGSWLCIHSTVLSGARLSAGTVISAHSVCTNKQYNEPFIYSGVPAIPFREIRIA